MDKSRVGNIQLTGKRFEDAQNRLAINKLIKTLYITLSTLALSLSIATGFLNMDLNEEIENKEVKKSAILSDLVDSVEYATFKDEKINSAVNDFRGGKINEESLDRIIDNYNNHRNALSVSHHMSTEYQNKVYAYEKLDDEIDSLEFDKNNRIIFASVATGVVGFGLFACTSHLFYNKIKDLEVEEIEFQNSQNNLNNIDVNSSNL